MRQTKPVQVKHLQIGGGAPVVIQSMTKTDTSDVGATVAQIEEMVRAGCEIVATADDAELFLYPGDQHYFADSSLPSYDPEATALLKRRVLNFLGRVQEARR